jgi:hypothetical protein
MLQKSFESDLVSLGDAKIDPIAIIAHTTIMSSADLVVPLCNQSRKGFRGNLGQIGQR